MTTGERTAEILRHLASRPGHDEVKADFRDLLVEEFGLTHESLRFEQRMPEIRGRIDALVGATVFEAKSDLRREWADVERRMPDYLAAREEELDGPVIGIASDGLFWRVVERRDDRLALVKETRLDPDRPEEFLAWLDGALALKPSLPPDPLTVRIELGKDSVTHRLVRNRLEALWKKLKDRREIALKRRLWADLLRLVYGRDVESDELWFQHSYLVVVAKCAALAVMNLMEDDPAELLSGAAFQEAGIEGAVESDFFDWLVAAEDGRELVRRVMKHVRRFRLKEVRADVLKVLYESLIDREERHGLGEYYTPDWLAAKMVRRLVDRPLEQRVLDPACGSGTFLFHAVRRFLEEAEEAALPRELRALEATRHIAGMDIHPVAVIIARVTYLMALGPVLGARQQPISIPVYLADALQLSVEQMFTGRELRITVPAAEPDNGTASERLGNGQQLRFPEVYCRDPELFDKAIAQMRTASESGMSREQFEAALRRITEQHYRADVTEEQEAGIRDLGETYLFFDRLRREGRDTIWAYVARNFSRPLFFSAPPGWASVVIGNPPWVAFRHMKPDLQKRFKELAETEGIYVGGRFATQNDLAALFTVRAAHFYLKPGGRIGFVLPMAALTRGQFEKFRSGNYESLKIAWEEAWAMDEKVAPLFPVPAAVAIGRRQAQPRPLPTRVRAASGTLPLRDAPEEVADRCLEWRENAAITPGQWEGGSAYRGQFRQGATLVPRVLVLVERKMLGRLGANPQAPLVVSRRSPQEKEPWKSLPPIEKPAEAEFLRPVLLGESILPYRLFRVFEGVIPVTEDGQVLDSQAAADRGWIQLYNWLREAEKVWKAHGKSRIGFSDQLNYYGKLKSQFPIAPLRVVYAKAGTLPAACLIWNDRAVVDHMLYWMAPESEEEGRYLVAILNSETARGRIAHLQARGQFGARHFDKVMFNLPIPRFRADEAIHRALARAAAEAERVAEAVELPERAGFQRAHRRAALLRDAAARGPARAPRRRARPPAGARGPRGGRRRRPHRRPRRRASRFGLSGRGARSA